MTKVLRVLDNTAIATARTCGFKYFAGMVQHRRRGKTSAPLFYGTMFHKLLEIFYKTGNPILAKLVAKKLYEGKEPKPGDYRTLARAMLVFDAYVEKYGFPDPRYEVTVGYPDAPAIELSSNIILPRTGISYAVRIDRIFRINKLLYIEDHKTSSAFGATFFKEFYFSPQMMGYLRAAELLIGEKVHGVRINAIITRTNDEVFHREIITYQRSVIDHWEDETARMVDQIAEWEHKGHYPKSFKCFEKYGACEYLDVCNTPPDLQQLALEQDFDYAPWNPLTLHDDE